MHVRSRTRAALLAAPAALLLATAAACGSSTPSTTTTSTPGGGTSPGTSSAALQVTSNHSLGEIVTTGGGLTVYRYDADTAHPSKSNCNAGCENTWPPVLMTGTSMPKVTGVSQSLVGEVTRSDGSKQLTVDGWPVYTYAGDTGPGSTSGQGVGGVWHAVTPTGGKAGGSGGSGSSPSPTGTGNGYGY